MFYSPSKNGFYLTELHGQAVPTDAIEISSAEHDALMMGQAAGMVIVPSPSGHPTLREPEPTGVATPLSITMRQCRLQLLAAGKLALVQPAIDAMPEPQRSAANIEWEYGTTVQRNSPLIEQLAPVLGWDTPEAINEQFMAASLL